MTNVTPNFDSILVSYLLHLALRKNCNSKPTSILWNLVNVDDTNMPRVWETYAGDIKLALIKNADKIKTDDDIIEIVKDLSLPRYESKEKYPRKMSDVNSLEISMRLVMSLFTDEDWARYTLYLSEAFFEEMGIK